MYGTLSVAVVIGVDIIVGAWFVGGVYPGCSSTVIIKSWLSFNNPSDTSTVTLLSPIWDKVGVQSITPVEGLIAIPVGMVVRE